MAAVAQAAPVADDLADGDGEGDDDHARDERDEHARHRLHAACRAGRETGRGLTVRRRVSFRLVRRSDMAAPAGRDDRRAGDYSPAAYCSSLR